MRLSACGVRSTGRLDLFRSKVLPARPIDAGREAVPHARMATGASGTELSDLHMIALGGIAHLAIADVDDIDRWLGVPVVVAEILCADLKARVCSRRHAATEEARAASTTLSRGRRSHGQGSDRVASWLPMGSPRIDWSV